jgi:hypothetical protein
MLSRLQRSGARPSAFFIAFLHRVIRIADADNVPRANCRSRREGGKAIKKAAMGRFFLWLRRRQDALSVAAATSQSTNAFALGLTIACGE